MAKGFNKVTLMGNLTRDVEMRTTPSGQSVANFSLAVSRSWKGQDGQTQEQTSFINCVAWGKAGEIIAQYDKKGDAHYVCDDVNCFIGYFRSSIVFRVFLERRDFVSSFPSKYSALVCGFGCIYNDCFLYVPFDVLNLL